MQFYKIIIGLFAISLLLTCNPKGSLVLVGYSHHAVVHFVDEFCKYDEMLSRNFISKDTIVMVLNYNNAPLESMFLFYHDTCYYQDTKIYCSECSEKYMKEILEDGYFKFKEIDKVNYQSTVDKNIIMRVKPINNGQNESCYEIFINNTAVHP